MERKQYDYLIIGGDAAGLSAVGQIRRMHKEASIGVLERGDIISYGACGLPYAISGQIDDFNKLIHFTPDAFAARNHCDVLTGTEAIAVDFEKHSVTARSAQGEAQFQYGKMIIGTGAEAVRPALIPASDRFLVLKSIPDGRAIAERIKAVGARSVLILGAGYIGLEMADVLHSMGLQIEIVDMADRPVPRMPAAISKAVARKLEEKQIPLYAGEAIQSARDTGTGIQCATSNRTLDADLAVVAIGIRPATGFLDESKIKLVKGAIDINAFGETSVSDVYAGGDCALAYHRLLRKNVYMPLG
ncbi:MAG: FAD-dependent oxidoreductase, partial [Leptospiraceae bacterium]|nr:FAD-dependent oxidoreductase [Leptospiraceae bacterium]